MTNATCMHRGPSSQVGFSARRVSRRLDRLRAAAAAITGALCWGGAGGSALAADADYTNTNTPVEILNAYKIGTVQKSYTGAGQTIAIYTDGYYSTLQSDVNYFSTKYMGGVTTTVKVTDTSGTNLTGLNSDGNATSSASAELALDVEYSHLIAPGATIVVVNSGSESSAAYYAANTLKASVFSTSYGGHNTDNSASYESSANSTYQSINALGHTTVLAAAGDSGTLDYPGSSPYVVGVGGTNLTVSGSGSTSTYRSETGWTQTSGDTTSGGGGGQDVKEAMPEYQVKALGTAFGSYRVGPDVSIAGGPYSSMPVFTNASDASDYSYHYGSSIATPIWAGIMADVDQARVANGLRALSTIQTLDALYATYTNGMYSSLFHDVSGGTNSSGESATTGYDELTGLGSPIADALVDYLATVPAPEPTSLLLVGPGVAGLLGRRRRPVEGTRQVRV